MVLTLKFCPPSPRARTLQIGKNHGNICIQQTKSIRVFSKKKALEMSYLHTNYDIRARLSSLVH